MVKQVIQLRDDALGGEGLADDAGRGDEDVPLGDAEGGVHVAYTWHRQAIKHVHLPGDVLARIRAERPTSAGPDLSAEQTA